MEEKKIKQDDLQHVFFQQDLKGNIPCDGCTITSDFVLIDSEEDGALVDSEGNLLLTH